MTAIRNLALLWAGIVIGCTFIATPVKFLAPSLDLATALQVGRVTFRAVGVVELALGLALLALASRAGRLSVATLAPMGFLAIEWAVVMPLLMSRSNAVVAGQTAPSQGGWHLVVVALELAKLAGLLRLGLAATPFASGASEAIPGKLP